VRGFALDPDERVCRVALLFKKLQGLRLELVHSLPLCTDKIQPHLRLRHHYVAEPAPIVLEKFLLVIVGFQAPTDHLVH